MGRSTGTGCPIWFRCFACRRKASASWGRRSYSRGGGSAGDVTLTGRTRKLADGMSRGRSSDRSREYRCGTCGFLGWSRHVDLSRRRVTKTHELDP